MTIAFLRSDLNPPSLDSRITALISKLKHVETGARVHAANALGRLGDRRAVDPLCTAVTDDGCPQVRRAAAQALQAIGDRRATEPLCSAVVTDGAPEVRRAAARALGRLGDVHAVRPLCRALVTDTEWQVRQTVAEALDRIRGDRVRPSRWPMIAVRG